MTSFYIRSLSIALLTVLLEGVPVEGQAVGSPRVIISLDGQGWNLVGLGPGQGEKLGVNLHDSAKAVFIPTSVPNDVELAIGIKDVYSQDPAIFDINKRE